MVSAYALLYMYIFYRYFYTFYTFIHDILGYGPARGGRGGWETS